MNSQNFRMCNRFTENCCFNVIQHKYHVIQGTPVILKQGILFFHVSSFNNLYKRNLNCIATLQRYLLTLSVRRFTIVTKVLFNDYENNR